MSSVLGELRGGCCALCVDARDGDRVDTCWLLDAREGDTDELVFSSLGCVLRVDVCDAERVGTCWLLDA